MLAAHITVELFWQTIVAILIFVTWWYPTGLWKNTNTNFGATKRGGLAFGALWLFKLWIATFSQLVAVGIDHEETAVQIATILLGVICILRISFHISE
jgi:ATP-binding cassette subfamily G (WHITE) protein 2 (PDR)